MLRVQKVFKFKIFMVPLLVANCAHDRAWVADKKANGGRIGYAQSMFFDHRKETVRDFNKAAAQICKKRSWVIVREVIPPPTEVISAARNAGRGDVEGTVSSTKSVLWHEVSFRNARMNKDVKVEYGNPFKSWNEAEIHCDK